MQTLQVKTTNRWNAHPLGIDGLSNDQANHESSCAGASRRKGTARKSAKSRNYRKPPVRRSKKISKQTSDDAACDEGLSQDQSSDAGLRGNTESRLGATGRKGTARKSTGWRNYRKPRMRRSEQITTQTSDDAECDEKLSQDQSSDAGMKGKTNSRTKHDAGLSAKVLNNRDLSAKQATTGNTVTFAHTPFDTNSSVERSPSVGPKPRPNSSKSAKSRNYRKPPARRSKKIITQASDDAQRDEDLSHDQSSDAGMKGKTNSRLKRYAGRSEKPLHNHDLSAKQATTLNTVTFAHTAFDTHSSVERSPGVGPKPRPKPPPRRNPGRSAKSNNILTIEPTRNSTVATYRHTKQDRDDSDGKTISKKKLAPRTQPQMPTICHDPNPREPKPRLTSMIPLRPGDPDRDGSEDRSPNGGETLSVHDLEPKQSLRLQENRESSLGLSSDLTWSQRDKEFNDMSGHVIASSRYMREDTHRKPETNFSPYPIVLILFGHQKH